MAERTGKVLDSLTFDTLEEVALRHANQGDPYPWDLSEILDLVATVRYLQEQFTEERQKRSRLTQAIENLDKRMLDENGVMTVTEGDEEIIKFYNVPCGPWHHILGIVRG